MTDLAFRSAVELARLIREGSLSSRELLDSYLSRMERYNPRLNAVVSLDVERAREAATRADDARSRGERVGPFHGVPVTIKDSFETAGLRTTCGSPKLRKHVPMDDAVAVARYRGAGAIVFGKSNLPLFCGDHQSYNELFGTTNNPWDLMRTPGGSSGGAAAALAAGLTGLELGSDIAGSIRVPASWSGVYGHKPSWGIVPQAGHIPPPPRALTESDLGVMGPLARSAADLMQALDVLAGPDAWQATGWRLELPGPRASSLRDYRVAAWFDDPSMPVDDRVLERLLAAVDALRKAGVTVDDQARPAIDAAKVFRTFQALMNPLMAAGYPPPLFERFQQLARTEDPESEVGAYARDVTETHREWLSANARRAQCRARWAEFFTRYDVLLCPTVSVPAIVHDTERPMLERTVSVNGKSEPYGVLQRWVSLATLAHLPATTAPVGRTSSGLPVGIQIIAPYLEDRTSIDFAEKLSLLIGGFEPPPEFLP